MESQIEEGNKLLIDVLKEDMQVEVTDEIKALMIDRTWWKSHRFHQEFDRGRVGRLSSHKTELFTAWGSVI